ncbi:ParB/RepB/Spo0J family partition protein [Crocosphaera chwakensis]|uniref:Chromosome partitioning protein, ParB family n=1 Tax=Crocosphaera chwakensis CCY0110 TaxID=391612 RepID=A3IM73_9CHRO|nr:ParB/RepB/Spo0J family partition protein [Crocosphaera chwakensis]EAZ92529.1 chromosome partitioning protein, ParB family [Crocosphaera chwakensis CCY0110]
MDQSQKRDSSKKMDKQPIAPIGQWLDIEQIQLPQRQPRRSFNQEKLDELTASIEEYGILEPLIVRPLNDHLYELVAGERRYRAAKNAQKTQIPVIVKDIDEQQAFELALLENMQRDDLNAIDETEGMLELIRQTLEISSNQEVIQVLNKAANAQRRNQPLTDNVKRQIEMIDDLFVKIGRLNRESFRTNRLPLLNLPDDVLQVLRQGELDYTKAKAIAKLDNEIDRRNLMELAITEQLTLRQIKEKMQEILEETQTVTRVNTSRDLYSEFKAMTKIKSDAWKDESKKAQLETLLMQLRDILE